MSGRANDEKSIFLNALEITSPGDREAYLDGACGDDQALRQQVQALLEAYRGPFRLLDAADRETCLLNHGPVEDRAGETIGPYRLLEAIGEGGMGVVYMAQQERPVRRKVALKLIKPGMDSRQVIARFEVERQALAMMDHPNIAKVHDAGTTADGRPYFVMELVRGIPITEYCDRERLSIRERLELFVLVCRAVQHAHQKGIIHRDLKPSNVLVTVVDGAAVPKVIDFGIAKAVDQRLTERTCFTAFAQMIGTPLYMSPEQAELSGVDVDTRSDVYGLGVLLYELLTGTTPFDSETLKKAAFDEMRRIIREEEPPRPSTRLSSLGATLSTVSARRKADPRRLGPSLRGELDWVVMKALEKDRRRRYETASDFAADVTRYLADEPVEACPPSTWYGLTKFARRHRAGLTSAALIMTAVVAGVVASVWQAVVATNAKAEAEKRAEETRMLVAYLVDDLFGTGAPDKSKGRVVTMTNILKAGEEAIPTRFGRRPLAEAAAREALGQVYSVSWDFDSAARQFRRVVEIRERLLGLDHPETLSAQLRFVESLAPPYSDHKGNDKEAESVARRVVAAYSRLLGPEHPETCTALHRLSWVLTRLSKFDEALAIHKRVYSAQERILGPSHLETLLTLDGLGMILENQLKLADAESVFRRVVDERRRIQGPAHRDFLASLQYLGRVLNKRGRYAESAPMLTEVFDNVVQMYGLASIHCSSALRELLKAIGGGHNQVAMRDLCQRLMRQILEEPPEADVYLRERRSIRLNGLVLTLVTLPESIPFDAELAVKAARDSVALHEDWDDVWTILGLVHYRLGQLDEAEKALQTSMERPKWRGGDDFDWLAMALIQGRRGNLDQAREWYDRARSRKDPVDFNREDLRPLRDEAERLLGLTPSDKQ
jgi:serine/threonine protein kinase/tetratricopeptide (TPR) repeat protein